MYRKYPLRAECDMTFRDGNIFPQELITSMQITTLYGAHKLYITKVFVGDEFMSVTVNNYTDGTVIGCFAGKVTNDFAVLPFISSLSTVAGNMTTGTKSTLKKLEKGSYFLRDELNNSGSKDNALLEDSVIFCFAPPAVTKIQVGDKTVAGHLVTTRGNNVTVTSESATELSLNVINADSILSNNEFSGSINNCPTSVIRKINTVYPDEDGNIDIYGILPIVIDVESGEVSLASGLDLLDVCPERNKISPPVDATDVYYTDILNTIVPEWKTWPNFT